MEGGYNLRSKKSTNTASISNQIPLKVDTDDEKEIIDEKKENVEMQIMKGGYNLRSKKNLTTASITDQVPLKVDTDEKERIDKDNESKMLSSTITTK